MSLEFEQAVKALEEHIDMLKQNLLFLNAAEQRKPESVKTSQIIRVKRELDKAVEEKMKLLHIYCSPAATPPPISISS